MKILNLNKYKLSVFLDVPSTDPDDARRRKLLNIILIGLGIMAIILIILATIWIVINPELREGVGFVYISGIFFLLGTISFYVVNRIKGVPGWVASTLFLLFLLFILAFSDTPSELSEGRSLFVFALPIILASILLRPVFTFIFAGLVSLEIVILAQIGQATPNTIAIVFYLIVALISWLSSRGLDRALKDLRQININLDRLVAERTQALAASLSRERIVASRSKAILESIADGVIVFDNQSNATIANPSSTRLLEIPQEDLTGMTIAELCRVKALDAKNRNILGDLLTNSGQQLTSIRVQWDRKTLSVTSAQVRDSEEIQIGSVAVFRDYSREAEIERMKNTFLAIVSHELRTPLNAILGYAEMLKEGIYGQINPKQTRASERILVNTNRLLEIVSDLLDQAKIEAGKMKVTYMQIRPADIIDSMHSTMDKHAAEKGLTLTSEIDPELPEIIKGDPVRLHQILINLVNNSIKFTEMGSIHVRLVRFERRRWNIEVQDTGIGIAKEDLSQIFTPFHQVDSSVSRRYGGFGLGLAIVKQLTDLMKGHVSVTSTKNSGSLFCVTLPLRLPRKPRINSG